MNKYYYYLLGWGATNGLLLSLAFEEDSPLFVRGLLLGLVFGVYIAIFAYSLYKNRGQKQHWLFYLSPVVMLATLGYGFYLAIETEQALRALS
ncbi:MAG: hypothetical protein SPK09_07925 [Porphyromonas sp.]|nr:hypothetical protein [Porphyromonas sp.]